MPPGQSDGPRRDDETTVGAALRVARETAGRTVEQVAADTRIRATLIRDLEADRFASSGAPVYARGHLKSIAASLGVDSAPLLALFDQGHQEEPPVLLETDTSGPIVPAVTSFGGSAFAGAAAALTPERRGPRWGLAVIGAAAVLTIVTAIGYASKPGTSPATTVALDKKQATTQPTETTVVHTPDPNSVASKPAVTGAQLRVRLIGGDSWVSISNAGGTLFEGLLRSGEFRDFADARRLKVVVGNALAVSLNCGGKDSGPAGASGKVAHFVCTAAGLAAL